MHCRYFPQTTALAAVANRPGLCPYIDEVIQTLLSDDAPKSWQQVRNCERAVEVRVEFSVNVEEIRSLCQEARRSKAQKQQLKLPVTTGPLAGLRWQPAIEALFNGHVTEVSLQMETLEAPENAFFVVQYTAACPNNQTQYGSRMASYRSPSWQVGNTIASMPGAWDAGEWESYGLPDKGQLVYDITIHEVS